MPTRDSATPHRTGPFSKWSTPVENSRANLVSQSDVALRKLTAKVLEQLKAPSAIPSNVILAALKAAREIC